MIGLFNFFHLN